MLNLIFIHGISAQPTGYSNTLFRNILKAYKAQLKKRGLTRPAITQAARRLVQKEILWAHRTTDLSNRFLTMQYRVAPRKGKWNFILKGIDPLVIQTLFYVKDKGHKTGPMGVLKTVHREFKRACNNRPENVVVIGHSLGSVIGYDYLFGFRRYKLDPRRTVDAFITLGSPIPLFTSAMGYVENPVSKPKNLKRWVNIIDPDDGVARFCGRHFKKFAIEDLELNTGWDPIGAHTGYWKSGAVAENIAKRLIAWGI